MSAALLIGLTLILFLYLLINRVANKHISANARYIAGLVLLLAFLIPYRFSLFDIPMPSWMRNTQEKEMTITVDLQTQDHPTEIVESGELTSDSGTTKTTRSVWYTVAIGIYIAGVAISLFLTLKNHFVLQRTLKRAYVLPSEELLWQFDMLCGKMEFRRKPKLIVCHSSVASSLGAPFTFGILQRKVVMPSNVYGEEAEMLMEHELHHCKRWDTFFDCFL